ncbi:helix-turn-helix transcriptional regulator [Nannocystis sp. SCPEA4]|uniref:helix-turn-helix transcriptional regulator n=1 Tax=Nannocystis sp. SCPEA4 TaxID=2996787 RepID=UPI002271DF6A|nr:helix-turn-helix transcriptional regulator [Nannocystis sp. SCPEA4]MCY1059913.1 helix-turn-helix transcriptional regulator [Nannocystis sp. SCPEA4]
MRAARAQVAPDSGAAPDRRWPLRRSGGCCPFISRKEPATTRQWRDSWSCVEPTIPRLGRDAKRAGRRRRPLTPREAQVLELLLGGQNEKQLAAHLGLSIHTIHQYTKGVFCAFDVSSRAELKAKFVSPHRPSLALTRSPSLHDSS